MLSLIGHAEGPFCYDAKLKMGNPLDGKGLRKNNMKVDFYHNGRNTNSFVFIYSSRIMSTLKLM